MVPTGWCLVFLDLNQSQSLMGNENSSIVFSVVARSISVGVVPFNSAILLMTAGRISEVFRARRRSYGWITSLQ